MFKKPQQQPTRLPPRLPYRSPRLTEFGKLHAIVAGGASGEAEGMSMSKNKRG